VKPPKKPKSLKAPPSKTGVQKEALQALSFEFADLKTGLKAFQNSDLAKLLEDCSRLSSQPWLTLIQERRQARLGYEKIPVLFLNRPLPSDFPQDIDSVSVFRFCGQKARLIGHKTKENTFYVFWLDFDFVVYKHG
jgi:hypothetical protein